MALNKHITAFTLLIFAIWVQAQTSTSYIIGGTCQTADSVLNIQGHDYCCPGVIYGYDSMSPTNLASAYCCVGATVAPEPTPTAGVDSIVTTTTTSTQSCLSTITLLNAAYSSEASAAESLTSMRTTSASTTSTAPTPESVSATSTSSGLAACVTVGPFGGPALALGGILAIVAL